jgi:hypothetical protein
MGYNTHLAFFKGNKILLFFLRRSKFLFLHFSMISLWDIKKERRNGEVTFIVKKDYFFLEKLLSFGASFSRKETKRNDYHYHQYLHYNQSRTFGNSHALYMYQTADLKERSQCSRNRATKKKSSVK